MKMPESSTRIYKSQSFEESSFGIDNNEDMVHIFNILRSKIYTNKVLAVVREYSTNAQDAHIENGTPGLPIEVTLPNNLYYNFSVRDFGKGLSEEDVRNVYVKYGRSTKRDSNDFNGQLGLGCKAGFAYGDSFQVTSFHNGREMNFECYIDETQIGKVAKLRDVASDEPSGIKITIPVKNSDINVFQRTAANFYKYFTPVPKFNNSDFTLADPPIFLEEKDNFTIFSGNYYLSYPAVFMGNVAYPIDTEILIKNDKIGDVQKIIAFRHTPVMFTCPIGSVNISSSREGLEYDKKTIEFLYKRIEEIYDKAVAVLSTDFNQAQDIFEAKKAFGKLVHGHNPVRSLFTSRSLTWNDIDINSDRFTYGGFHPNNFLLREYNQSSTTQSGLSMTKQQNYRTWYTIDSIKFIFDDINRPGNGKKQPKVGLRVKAIFEKYPKTDKVFVIQSILDDQSLADKFDDFKEKTGIDRSYFENLSSCLPLKRPKVALAPKIKTAPISAKVLKYKFCHSSKQMDYWEPDRTIDLKTSNQVYVLLDRYVPDFKTSQDITKIEQYLTELDSNFAGVYGIKKSIADKVTHWTHLKKYINLQINNLLADPEKMLQMLVQAERFNTYFTNNTDSSLVNLVLKDFLARSKDSGLFDVKTFSSNSSFGNYLATIEEIEKQAPNSKTEFNAYQKLAVFANRTVELEKAFKNIKLPVTVKDIWDAYPLLRHLFTRPYGRFCTETTIEQQFEEVRSYIEIVDQRNDVSINNPQTCAIDGEGV